MTDIGMEIAEVGQELFGEEIKERETAALQRAFDEALGAGQQEAASALLDELTGNLPVWNGWPAALFNLDESYTAGLLDEVADFIRPYVVLHDGAPAILAAWVLHTYVFQCSLFTPYIFITAAEKASGKSLLADVLRVLVRKPRRNGGMSAAALVKIVDRDRPTLFLDEMDAQMKSSEEFASAMQGILNEGYRRDGVYTKCFGKDNEPHDFAIYCPKCIIGIGDMLHDTTASRSIRIEMKRKTAAEHVRTFDTEYAEQQAAPIRERIASWARVVAPVLRRGIRQGLVEGWDGRQNDTARPLLTIALLAGQPWHTRLLAALQGAFASNAEATESFGTMLLSDIRDYFDERRGDRAPSFELLEYLHQLEERSWVAWGSRREKMQPNQLAAELRKYGIRPRTIRMAGGTPKGYYRADFEDAWQRFCSPPSANSATAATAPQPAYSLAKSVAARPHVAATEAQQEDDEPGLDF
jgi:hypothetical protein